MRLLAVSDLHGDLAAAWRAVEAFRPDLLLCCGDWGDPDEVSERELAAFPARLPTYTTFGNHDALVQGNAAANVAFEQVATGCLKPIGPVPNPENAAALPNSIAVTPAGVQGMNRA